MAMFDYYWCDVCGCKAFYDADLDFSMGNLRKLDKRVMPGKVGDMRAICVSCSETHEIIVLSKGAK